MKVSAFQPMNVHETPIRQVGAPAMERMLELSTTDEPGGIISQDEKQYFTKLYPNDSQTIKSYSTYSKKGVTKDYFVGSLIDKQS